MSLQLKVSNSLSGLVHHLCRDLQIQSKSVFQSDYLVTQTEGMNSWLKMQLAAGIGIAANYRFLKPNDLIHDIFKVLGGQFQDSLSPQNQSWFLFRLLSETAFKTKFPHIAHYYTELKTGNDLKRLALAEKIADLFDQYQMYRPDMIRGWNQGRSKGFDHEDWQMYLWTNAKSLSEVSLPDKTYVADYILEALQDAEKQCQLQRKMPRVQLVGLSVLTDFHMNLFSAIGEHIDLNFYILNPAPSMYWYEDKSEKRVAFLKKQKIYEQDEESLGNALLTSWGSVYQNTFNLLFKDEGLINSYDEVGLAVPAEASLLQKVQSDLFHNRSNQERAPISIQDLQDGSISIHSSFTPLREVEALYNYLVRLVDRRNEELSARDIVVMVSDINVYAPYIKAVFNNAPYNFPFSIADERYSDNDSISACLLSILAINTQNFKAEVVLQLLDSSYIRQRFGLTDLSLIRKIVHQANFRFGMKGKKEDQSIFISWKYAAQRIIYGICMSGADEYYPDGESLFPLNDLEGSDTLEIVRFWHFMEVLIGSIEERELTRTLSEWVSYAEKVMSNLVIDSQGNNNEEQQLLVKQLSQYNEVSGTAEKIRYQLFHHNVRNLIDTSVRTGSFVSSGITFCSLIPMRSVPFKVVCLLGLDFNKFPRKEHQLSFNLIKHEKRKGDRNVKENDKHLFLETLLSAQKYIYISYLGQSVKDNTTVPPSALVDELVEYIQGAAGTESVKSELTTKHPIHGFSNRYRAGNPKLYNYLDHHRHSVVVLKTNKAIKKAEFKEVGIDSLINFLKHPIKGYFNRTLNIYYNDDEVLLRETELFEVDHLQKYHLKQILMGTTEVEVGALQNQLLKTGGLPLKNMATVVLNGLQAEVAPVKALVQECADGFEEEVLPVQIDFEDQNIQIQGTLKQIYNSKLIVVSWSKNATKYLLEAYIKYLCARAAGHDLECLFIYSAKNAIYSAGEIQPEVAKERLSDLLKLYRAGHESPIPFYPGFGFDQQNIEEFTHESFKKAIANKIEDYNYPISDLYVIKKYREGFFDLKETFENHQGSAVKLLLPLKEIFADFYK